MPLRQRYPHRQAFTLLEVILASMLTAVVLLILATSMQIQYRAFNSGRTQVEEAQLARVLLHRMRDDLSALLPPGEIEGSGGSTGSSGEEGESEQVSGLTDDGDDLFSDTSTPTEATIGLYGELDWLRVDILRPARIEAESSEDEMSVGTVPLQSEGEIKRIIYYVLEPQTVGFNAGSTDSDEPTGGLVRRELNGPTAAYGVEIGTLEYCDTTVPPIASEVSAVEFRYHDGEDWVESWDSSEEGGLPKAIEIRLFLTRKTETNTALAQATSSTAGTSDEGSAAQYRLVVPITVGTESSSGGDSSGGDTFSDSSLLDEGMEMMGGDQ